MGPVREGRPSRASRGRLRRAIPRSPVPMAGSSQTAGHPALLQVSFGISVPTTLDGLSVSAPTTTVTIWHNASDSAFLGWQPGDPMIKVFVYRIPATQALSPDRVLEEAFTIFNEGRNDRRAQAYWRARNRSLSVGDVVVVADLPFTCDLDGWSPLNGTITASRRGRRGSTLWNG